MKLRINYTLKSGVTSETAIIANINFGYKELDVLQNKSIYKPLRYYTGLKINKSLWNTSLDLIGDLTIRYRLKQIEEMISESFLILKNQGDLSPDNLKRMLDAKIKGVNLDQLLKRIRIVDFIQQDIMALDYLKPNTKKSYQGLANKLIDYELTTRKPLYAHELSEKVYKDFMSIVRDRVGKLNTVWTIQKIFKSTLKEIGRKYKIPVFNPGTDLAKPDKIQVVDTSQIYLTFDQIQQLMDFKPDSDRLKNVKLILLTLIFTGCRESDVYKIQPQYYYEKDGDAFYYSTYFAQKGNKEISVPFLKPLTNAIDENNGRTPKKIAQQKLNEYIKELAEKCGFTETVTIPYIDSKGVRREAQKRFCDLMSTHIGRRSFVSNLIHYIPEAVLSKVTGHSMRNRNIIYTYNKISLIDNLVLFRKLLIQARRDNPDHFTIELV